MAGYTPTRTFTPAQREAMDRITHGLPTKSAKMRALEPAGYSRSDIAAYLGTSYQHVRSVLGPLAPVQVAGPEERTSSPDDEFADMGVVKVDATGRVQLPPQVLLALDAEPGFTLLWRLEGDTLTIYGPHSGLRVVQDKAQKYVVPGEELASEQLMRERREEVAREEAKDRELYG